MRLNLCLLIFVQVCALEVWSQISRIPPRELIAAVEFRKALKGHIKWSCEDIDGIVNHADQFTENERIFIRDMKTFNENGEFELFQEKILYYDGKFWRVGYNAARANVYDIVDPKSKRLGDSLYDIQTLGMTPFNSGKEKDIWGHKYKRSYETEQDGNLVVVTATEHKNDETGYQYKWWINPSKDWSVVRQQVIGTDGEVKAETLSVINQFGDKWFPELVQVYTRGVLQNSIYVHKAEFDGDLPDKLVPEDIAIGVGSNISYTPYGGSSSLMSWDGIKMQDFREVFNRVQSGELQTDPVIASIHARYKAEYAVKLRTGYEPQVKRRPEITIHKKRNPDLWEEWVRQFIHQYHLNDEQQQKAWILHKDCVRQAKMYLRKFRLSLDDLRETKNSFPSRLKVKQHRTETLEAVEKIFSKNLEPRLHNLLTRKQNRKYGNMKE